MTIHRSPFALAFEATIGFEGDYSDHPSDPGKATRYGITERVARAHGYTADMRELPLALAKQIYFASYWLPIRGDELPEPVALDVFDAAVNHGVRQATLLMQRALRVDDDGHIGPVTIAAAMRIDAPTFIARFNGERLTFYADLPTWSHFGKGWTRRVAAQLRRV
jgi:lysozyme family protein